MKSKFSYRTYLFVGLIFQNLILPINLFINRIEAFGENYNLKFFFVGSLMLITCFWLILGTLKRVISLEIANKKIIVKNIFKIDSVIKLEDLDGFEKTIETSRGGSYEVIYLMKNKKSLVHISEFHLANYKEIKKQIEFNVKKIGNVEFSFLSHWKRYK